MNHFKTTKGIEFIHAQENKKIEDVSEAIQSKREEELKEALQKNDIDVYSMFDDYVMVGDSRILGFESYGLLPSSRILAGTGYTVEKIDESLEAVQSLQPKNIYISYGANDMAWELGDMKDGYGKLFEKQVKKILKVCPHSKIYVLSIIPATASLTDSSSNWARYKNYNQQLEKMCKRNQWKFIDCSSLAQDGQADIYQEDGFHFVREFYDEWAMKMMEATLK